VKTLILEAVNAWRNYERVPSRSSADVTEHEQAGQDQKKNVYCHSRGSRMWLVFNETRTNRCKQVLVLLAVEKQ